MSYQAMKRHRGNLSACCLVKKSQSEKATQYMVPTIWHSKTGIAIETEKDQWFSGIGTGMEVS